MITEKNNPEKNSNITALWRKTRILGLIFGIIGVLVLGYFILKTLKGVAVPDINQGMSYGLLFIVGLLTGFHCIAMCGGFVIGFTAKGTQENGKTYQAPLLYGVGKLVSYSVIGAIFGCIGSIIAFTPLIRGIVGITAGVVLVIIRHQPDELYPLVKEIVDQAASPCSSQYVEAMGQQRYNKINLYHSSRRSEVYVPGYRSVPYRDEPSKSIVNNIIVCFHDRSVTGLCCSVSPTILTRPEVFNTRHLL